MKKLKNILAFASILILFFVSTNVVQAKDKVIKVSIAWPQFVSILGDIPVKNAKQFNINAKGIIQLDWNYYKDHSPLNGLDDLKTGKFDAIFSTPGYFEKKLPGTGIFSAVPFGANELTMFSWLKYGGGQELYQEALDKAKYNVKVISPCLMIPPEGGGWYNKPINKPSDLKGLNMRIFGVSAAVFKELGVNTVLLPGKK